MIVINFDNYLYHGNREISSAFFPYLLVCFSNTMDMNWYRSAEYYIEKNEWPARLRPTLKEDGFVFEVEKPLGQAGILLIPGDWNQTDSQPINNAMVFRLRSLPDASKTVLENATTRLDYPTQPPKTSCTYQIMYDPFNDRRPKWQVIYCEPNTRKFASLIQGALPHGIILFKHEPKSSLFMYNGEDIWQWSGDLNFGFQIIISELEKHTAKSILLYWNNDLQRYLVNTVTPKKCILDWEADIDKPNIEAMFEKITDDRILAYNSITCLISTMNLATAKQAVRGKVMEIGPS